MLLLRQFKIILPSLLWVKQDLAKQLVCYLDFLGGKERNVKGRERKKLLIFHIFIIYVLEIPQFIKEAGMISDTLGGVAITQPRRVAAVNLAKRVAEETVTKLGGQVKKGKINRRNST